ncbi:uncharacterized protein P174DRAFT_436885 [Aspergillus novofumigatus IBT 16806]|uniref:Folliculin-interacting protein N-terminal domain-containing protein n=1 Tax=Aspergillus novofumigatus (strain IBT 16806) TaxID=1392255 RepID=A0A2I1CLH0_ASPN1|nr:uncharacterized protein P174DRAFT_436885 [Aspergillus novofumigatus IBT 16806]PKX98470.1 hypothetical protein P174DRAFT_436885 [Aspergillus novofumigatus IBT 16806]
MLGRLLSSAASTLNPAAYSNRNATQLESVTEEEHTSGLLFPDASLLRRSNTHAYPLHSTFNSPNAYAAGAYDDRGGVELDPVKDFRVIIAQNALGDRDACVLLDTRMNSSDATSSPLDSEPYVLDNSGTRHVRTLSSLSRAPRRGYLPPSSAADPSPFSVAAEARRSPPMGSGAFVRARGRSSTLSPAGGMNEAGRSRHPPENNDSGLLNCIFGSSAFSYRGSSTKMHIISADEDSGRTPSESPATRNSLSRAYTTGSSSGFMVTILLTRMFSVNLPEAGDALSDRPDYPTSIYQESLPENGFPFPDVAKRKKIKEKKTPMYAVAITIQIPLLSRNMGRPATDSPKAGMSCSLDSDHRWRGGFLDDSLLDERIDLLVDHWDRLSRKEILFLLKKPAKPPNMQRTNQTILKDEAFRSARRISIALQTPHVVTGQSRWGVWREEGRSIHSFFFLVLITAFLGNHTEWLSTLGPDWYRRRHYLQQKAQQDADPVLAHRTVIISPDKMTARRLIFLLSAFLPAKQRFEPLPSPLRPGTSAPPTVPVLRQEPLRRAIERRSRAQRLADSDNHQRSTAHRSADDIDTSLPELGPHRRGSDARSIRTLGVPMHRDPPTTSTATPSSAVPTRRDREDPDPAEPGANDSLASESSAISANSNVPSNGGRWGNLFSAEDSDARSVRSPPTLSQMTPGEASETTTSGTITIPRSSSQQGREENTPEPSSVPEQNRESSLKLSVRGDDGIVDVELPLPGFLSLSSSGDSTIASPKKARTSVTSVDALASTHSSNSGFHCGGLKDNDGPSNFHDDFLLQGVRPYAGVEADIKRAMQAEPTPRQGKWVDVATTLIADTRNFTVKRLRLRRKVVGIAASQPGTPAICLLTSFFTNASASSGTSANSVAEAFDAPEYEERFVEEPVMDLDGTLVDALERVLAQSGQSSLAHSRAQSPSRGRRGEDKNTSDTVSRDEVPSIEVPRAECRKMVLGALEEVVRSVTAEHCREDVDGEVGLADRERRRSLAGADNTLREGIRKWLLEVEEAW